MTFDHVWRFLESRKGERFHTLDQRKPFVLQDVQPTSLTVRVEASGYPRSIPRSHFEEAWRRLAESGRLSRSEIHDEISRFNPAYVSTLLAHVPGVQYRLSPIVLTFTAQSQPPTFQPTEVSIRPTVPASDENDDSETPGAEEIEEPIADRLVSYGQRLGYQARKEWRTGLGNRIDVVWAQELPPDLAAITSQSLLPVVGFEIETSWRTRKHVKGDIFNLQDLGAALGIIVLCTGPQDSSAEVTSLRKATQRYVAKLGLRILVWTEAEVEHLSNPSPTPSSTSH
jgi:hypothetical protein